MIKYTHFFSSLFCLLCLFAFHPHMAMAGKPKLGGVDYTPKGGIIEPDGEYVLPCNTQGSPNIHEDISIHVEGDAGSQVKVNTVTFHIVDPNGNILSVQQVNMNKILAPTTTKGSNGSSGTSFIPQVKPIDLPYTFDVEGGNPWYRGSSTGSFSMAASLDFSLPPMFLQGNYSFVFTVQGEELGKYGQAFEFTGSIGFTVDFSCEESGKNFRLGSSLSDPMEIKAYPNPSIGTLFLDLSQTTDQDVQLRVHDSQGRELFRRQEATSDSGTKLKMDVSSLPSGIYYIEVQSSTQHSITKFVKQ